VLWWLKGKKSRFIDQHARACLNHTVSVFVLVLGACAVLGVPGALALYVAEADWTAIVFSGLLVLVLVGLGVFWFVVHLIAAFKALRGERYTPPLCWKFIR
jgi:uncharacterized Tic20 family protein